MQLTGISAGTYTCQITDANGCVVSVVVSISEPLPISTNSVLADVSCYGACDGTAIVIPTGGTPPYTYLWDNGQTTSTVTGLCGGSYWVQVFDANLCNFFTSVFISEPNPFVINNTVIDESSNGACDGTATVIPTGGIPPYNYLWDNGQTTVTAVGLCAGSYCVTVTDAFGCQIIDCVTINSSAIVYGCTDPAADNYNPLATLDDGSCQYCELTLLNNH